MNLIVSGGIFLLAFALYFKASDGSDSNMATIVPHQPLVWSGGFFTLNCTLVQSSIDASARDLEFYSSNPEVARKFRTEIINDLTIRTTLYDIHRNVSSANISCRFRGSKQDEVTLFVADRIRCIVSNWESMTCTWEKFQLGDEANFTLIYSRSRCTRHKFVCPNQSFNRTHGQCVFKKSRPYDYSDSTFSLTSHCFALKIQHSSGLTFKQIGLVEVKNFVKLNPVSGCQIYNISSSKAFVNWTAPDEYHHSNYRVTLISKGSDAIEANTTETWILLKNLIPNTSYTLTIDCIPVLYNGKRVGFWSDPKVLTFVSSPDDKGDKDKLPVSKLEQKDLQMTK